MERAKGIGRRDVLKAAGLAGGLAALPFQAGRAAALEPPPARSESRKAFRELLALLQEIEADWIGEERGIGPEDEPLAFRSLAMVLWGASEFYLNADLERPLFTRIVSPIRKWSDNPDALYFFAPLRGDREYRIRGRRGSEVYLNFTVHAGDRDGTTLLLSSQEPDSGTLAGGDAIRGRP